MQIVVVFNVSLIVSYKASILNFFQKSSFFGGNSQENIEKSIEKFLEDFEWTKEGFTVQANLRKKSFTFFQFFVQDHPKKKILESQKEPYSLRPTDSLTLFEYLLYPISKTLAFLTNLCY